MGRVVAQTKETPAVKPRLQFLVRVSEQVRTLRVGELVPVSSGKEHRFLLWLTATTHCIDKYSLKAHHGIEAKCVAHPKRD